VQEFIILFGDSIKRFVGAFRWLPSVLICKHVVEDFANSFS